MGTDRNNYSDESCLNNPLKSCKNDRSLLIKRDRKILIILGFLFLYIVVHVVVHGSEIPHYLSDVGKYIFFFTVALVSSISMYYFKTYEGKKTVLSLILTIFITVLSVGVFIIFLNLLVGLNDLMIL